MIKLLTGLRDWVDARLPIVRAWDTHMGKYYAPKNFNLWYFFGVLSLLVLVNQLLTGIWLTMSYVPSAEEAFASVEYIMRDVKFGWLIRYMHSTGASAFFVVVYLHMFRALLYGSYKKPRELVWLFGMVIFVALMAEAFLGYVLPWGQMSYWGAQVIISLFSAIPVVGDSLVEWVRGDYLISGITLNRFFALHVVAVPIILLALVLLHILALHEVGSNNPNGIEIKANKDENGVPRDGVPFHPYYTVHDIVGVTVFLFAFCGIIFFLPEMGGYFLEYANFEEANPLKTPDHIAPVWYFTPFYSILRAIPDKFIGFLFFAASVAILFVLPWLDRSPIKSWRYRGKVTAAMFGLFAVSFIILGVLGVKSPNEARTLLAQSNTVFYFAFFITMPFWTNQGSGGVLKFAVCWAVAGFLGYLTFLDLSLEKMQNAHVYAARVYAGVLTLWFVLLPFLIARDRTRPVPTRTTEDGIGTLGSVGLLVVILALAFVPLKAVGAESAFECGRVACDSMEPNPRDKASLQRGASLYMNYCMGCHSLQYSRYQRVANDLGIPEDMMHGNLIFDGAKVGSLMTNAMSTDAAKNWFGAPPPDLTLWARRKGPEWLYTYLRTFYEDPERPYGVNNLVFENVGMPHVLLELQGRQVCKPAWAIAPNGGIKRDPVTYDNIVDESRPCGRVEHVEGTGRLSPEAFDAAMYDLVNFLAYTAEPMKLDRQRIGIFTMLFLALFLVCALLLNREYWKDVH